MNLVSFSLFGSDPRYTEGAVKNAVRVPIAFPEFTASFFVDRKTVPESVVARLREAGARVTLCGDLPYRPKKLFRLFPLDEEGVEVVLFRDADSRITDRDRAAVYEWLASGKGAHLIRDYPAHYDNPVLGGLWGIRKGSFPGLSFRRSWVRHVKEDPNWDSLSDQGFLNRQIWPAIQHNLLVHDGLGNGNPMGTFDPEQGFSGEVYFVKDGVDVSVEEHRKVREDYLCQKR